MALGTASCTAALVNSEQQSHIKPTVNHQRDIS